MGELIEYKPKVESVGAQRLETSALGLTFTVKPKYVMVGIKLECTASIGSVYWQSFQETPKVSQKEQPAISGNWGIFSSAAGIFSSILNLSSPRCLKITIYILSGQKLYKNAKNGPFWRVFENLQLAVKQRYRTGHF